MSDHHRYHHWKRGVQLGLIVGSATWVWLALLDFAEGHPFRSFDTLGGVTAFTVVHAGVSVTFGVALLSTVAEPAHMGGLISPLFLGVIACEGGLATLMNLFGIRVVSVAWLASLAGSLVGAAFVMMLFCRMHLYQRTV